MTASSATARLRRPLSPRTTPRRNILGVFKQRDGADQAQPRPVYTGAPPAGGHPLGLPVEEEGAPRDHIAPEFDSDAMQAASSVVDRHIRQGPDYTISTDTSGWKRLSSLAGSIDPKDIADLAKTLTQGYTAVAHSWVEMADKLRDVLSSQGKDAATATAEAPLAPTLCIQSARRVSARVQMFSAGEIGAVHPLAPEDAGAGGLIADVAYEDGQIDIAVPEGAAAGAYHGVILSTASAPIGVVTLRIPAPDDGAS
jgi:hypothetical protein